MAEAQVDEAPAPVDERWEFECLGEKKAHEYAAAGWQPYGMWASNHCLRRRLP